MRYPEFLKENDTIGFVAPSFGCVKEPYHSAFKNALKKFEEMGYRTLLGPNCFVDKGIGISNTPKECGDELNNMYCSSKTDALISCGGGELMCEVLDFIDFDEIKSSKPKWYLGYSDNTNFIYPSAVISDTAAIYGPCAPTFGMDKWDKALFDTWDIITGKTDKVSGYPRWEIDSLKSEDNPFASYNLTEKKELVIFCGKEKQKKASFRGRLIGGCLDTLVTLTGTKYDKTAEFCKRYKDDGIIWFLESCDLSVMQIRRALWQLKHAGWFEGACGFIFGRPMHFDEPELGLDRHGAVIGILGDMNIPICMDADIGHLPPSMPIISGACADVECDENIHIKYSFT